MSKKTDCINLVSGVSHDLKSPLHAILGFTDLVKTELESLQTLPEKSIKHLDLIANIGTDMLELINNMLTNARMHAGKQSIEPLFVTHDVLISRMSELEETFKAEMMSRNIDFSISHGELPDLVYWDVKSLRYFVMNNLISNALKSVQKDGTVHVHVELNENNTIAVSIADNGPGIALAERERIFKRFTQSSDTVFSKENSGLGLYNANKMIETHHGTLEISDGLDNKGVTFTMRLPTIPFETEATLAV